MGKKFINSTQIISAKKTPYGKKPHVPKIKI